MVLLEFLMVYFHGVELLCHVGTPQASTNQVYIVKNVCSEYSFEVERGEEMTKANRQSLYAE